MAEHHDLGKRGEDKAVEYLIRNGYLILERNWRWKHNELDIVCERGDMLVVVEVKTREISEGRPEDLLDFRKRKNIRIAADAYIKARGIRKEVRFDLIIVFGDKMEISHIEEAIQVFE